MYDTLYYTSMIEAAHIINSITNFTKNQNYLYLYFKKINIYYYMHISEGEIFLEDQTGRHIHPQSSTFPIAKSDFVRISIHITAAICLLLFP